MGLLPYNRESVEGKRLYRLLSVQHNESEIDSLFEGDRFESESVPSVLQCKVKGVDIIIPGNNAGIKRPYIQVDSEVLSAWGDFSDETPALDFTQVDELPLHYTQPLNDKALSILIDAGMYSDSRFDEVINKLMEDESFDVESDMEITRLNIQDPETGDISPVIFAKPLDIIQDEEDEELSSINDLVILSAGIAIDLSNDGDVNQISDIINLEEDAEVVLEDEFDDVLAESDSKSKQEKAESTFIERSEYLDREIDVSDELADSVGYDVTDEEDRITELKDKARKEAEDAEYTVDLDEDSSTSTDSEDEDTSKDDDDEYDLEFEEEDDEPEL